MKHKLLIVEDEDKLRRVIELQLSSAGFEILKAATAEEALKLAGEAELILTDLLLPGMTGIEMIQALRRQNSSTPVIVMTAFRSSRTSRRKSARSSRASAPSSSASRRKASR